MSPQISSVHKVRNENGEEGCQCNQITSGSVPQTDRLKFDMQQPRVTLARLQLEEEVQPSIDKETEASTSPGHHVPLSTGPWVTVGASEVTPSTRRRRRCSPA
ncbi:unnamed protein product [Arctogadus glacialis]